MKIEELNSILMNGVKEVFTSGKFEEWLKSASLLPSYSWANTLLICIQTKGKASKVAGFNRWKELGRSVKKGEKALYIYAPLVYKRGKKEDVAEEKRDEKRVYGFKPVPVFDISQTEGDPLPEEVKICQELKGEISNFSAIWTALESVAGVPVNLDTWEDRDKHGYYYERGNLKGIKILSSMDDSMKIKTLIHETAHAILHGGKKHRDRGAAEVEAESVAFMVGNWLGLDTSAYSFGYVAGWAGDKDLKVLEESMETIQKTAKEIIAGIENHMEKAA